MAKKAAVKKKTAVKKASKKVQKDPIAFDADDQKPSGESYDELVQSVLTNVELLAELKDCHAEMIESAKELAERIRVLEQETLPDIMEKQLKQRSMTLIDGTKIDLKPDIKVSIAAKNSAAALMWLRKNKFDSIIKSAISVSFDPGQDALAKKLTKQLAANYRDYTTVKETVHPQTLKSFVKERQEEGTKLPESISVFPYYTVKLTPAK